MGTNSFVRKSGEENVTAATDGVKSKKQRPCDKTASRIHNKRVIFNGTRWFFHHLGKWYSVEVENERAEYSKVFESLSRRLGVLRGASNY